MGDFKIPAINIKGTDGSANTEGAFMANKTDDDKKIKFHELIAFNGATGYVSPPTGNIFGFGPASETT